MADANDIWEKKLQDPGATPMFLPLDFLKAITCDFSTEHELGRGGYGVVFKGVLRCGKFIAVKKLFEIHLLGDNKFHNEVSYLMGMKHQNVVQFVGYCAESSWEAMRLPGSVDYIFSELPKRLLCFEYVCNESLDKYISDESSGLKWAMRYEIIRGICDGLHYLHEECHIIHLDLKPENVLLGTNMVPKIADFGMSKIFGEKQSRIITESRAGTRGYMAPEYLIQGLVSIKADIFSLGVIIIEIITGHRDYPLSIVPYFQHFSENDSSQSNEASNQHFIEKILDAWRNRLQKSEGDTVKLEQIRVCAELGIQCTEFNPCRRPVTQHIIDRLDEVKDGSIKTGMISTWAVEPICAQNMVQDQVSIPTSKTDIPQEYKSTSLVVPDACGCPISQGLMKDPAVVATGQVSLCLLSLLSISYIILQSFSWHRIDRFDEVKDGSMKTGMIRNSAVEQTCSVMSQNMALQDQVPAVSILGALAASCTASEHDEVTKLLQKLASQNVLDQRGAAGTLRQLVKRNPECRACIGDSGGIPVLVSLLSTTDVSTQEHVVTALLCVSVHQENRRRIVSSGAVPGLVRVLERGSMEARENAAATLFSLSVVDEYKVTIGAAGSIPALLLLLSTGSRRGKKDAAAALFNLCIYPGNKSKAVRAGSVPILLLLELLTVTGNGMMDEALAILSILSSHPEGMAAISAAAAIPSLVGVIRNGSPRNKENSAAILLRLCNRKSEHQQQNLAQAQEQGLVSLLVELAESGTDRGKSKAIQLLKLIND